MKQSQQIRFTKMHALGNDFMIINQLVGSPFDIKPKWIQELANRKTGIGFDQCLVISKGVEAPFACAIYNADGSTAEQCGNGLRCVARFLHEQGFSKASSFQIETAAGPIDLSIAHYDAIKLNMRKPKIGTSLSLAHNAKVQCIWLGNPHAILNTNSYSSEWDRQNIVQQLQDHALFPHGVNVGFYEKMNSTHIKLKTFERGVGETLACGSNACAAVVSGILTGDLKTEVTVELALGQLQVQWLSPDQDVFLIGPASNVFEGEVSVNVLT